MSFLYPKALDALLLGGVDARRLRIILTTRAYQPDSHSTDEVEADIPFGATVGARDLAGATVGGGRVSAPASVFESLPRGREVTGIVVAVDNGGERANQLVAYINDSAGVPFTTNGADVTISWPDGVLDIA